MRRHGTGRPASAAGALLGPVHYLVTILGDPHRAAGLLAKAGIQNVRSLDPAARGTVSARLSADDPDAAVERVRRALDADALGPAGFTIGDARLEV
jgi:hypothetical protein